MPLHVSRPWCAPVQEASPGAVGMPKKPSFKFSASSPAGIHRKAPQHLSAASLQRPPEGCTPVTFRGNSSGLEESESSSGAQSPKLGPGFIARSGNSVVLGPIIPEGQGSSLTPGRPGFLHNSHCGSHDFATFGEEEEGCEEAECSVGYDQGPPTHSTHNTAAVAADGAGSSVRQPLPAPAETSTAGKPQPAGLRLEEQQGPTSPDYDPGPASFSGAVAPTVVRPGAAAAQEGNNRSGGRFADGAQGLDTLPLLSPAHQADSNGQAGWSQHRHVYSALEGVAAQASAQGGLSQTGSNTLSDAATATSPAQPALALPPHLAAARASAGPLETQSSPQVCFPSSILSLFQQLLRKG